MAAMGASTLQVSSRPFELARNYRWCADQLLDMALKQDATLDLRSPVLFAYRHALEALS